LAYVSINVEQSHNMLLINLNLDTLSVRNRRCYFTGLPCVEYHCAHVTNSQLQHNVYLSYLTAFLMDLLDILQELSQLHRDSLMLTYLEWPVHFDNFTFCWVCCKRISVS